jgi:hypothetical protein
MVEIHFAPSFFPNTIHRLAGVVAKDGKIKIAGGVESGCPAANKDE